MLYGLRKRPIRASGFWSLVAGCGLSRFSGRPILGQSTVTGHSRNPSAFRSPGKRMARTRESMLKNSRSLLQVWEPALPAMIRPANALGIPIAGQARSHTHKWFEAENSHEYQPGFA